MSRSVKKGPYVAPELLKRIQAMNEKTEMFFLKIRRPPSTTLPPFVRLFRAGQDGRKHVPVDVQEDMVGRKLGEFAPTRTFRGHAKDK